MAAVKLFPAYIAWTDDVGIPHAIYFDLCFQDGVTHSSEITKHPVEQGASVADHVRANPMQIGLQTFVSNTPIQDVPDHSRAELTAAVASVPGALTHQFLGVANGDFIHDTYSKLQALHDNHTLVFVVTPIKSYPNMVVTKLSLVRDKDNSGDAAKFDIDFEEIIIVQSDIVQVALLPQGQPQVPQGQIDTQTTDEPGDNQSLARLYLTGGLKGFLQ